MKRMLARLTVLFGSLFMLTAWAEEPEVVPGEYIIKFRASSGAAVAQTKLVGKAAMKSSFPGMGMYHVNMKGANEKSNVDSLRADPEVEFIEPNYVLKKSEIEPNEPVEAMSYEDVVAAGASTDPQVYSQSAADTGVETAWQQVVPLSSYSEKITVAVIDTGLDRYHDVFKTVAAGGTGALWINQVEANGQSGVDDDQNGYVDDVNGWNFITNNGSFVDDDDHGTHVAGIIVGTGQNIFARPLQESKILVMPLKFLGGNGSGSTSNAIRAIYYAVNNGARVINNSWGGPAYSRALHDAITYAYDNKVLVVSAAGNYGSNNDSTPMYPSSYDVPSNLSIASTSSYDYLSSFSNYGASSVHFGSPGEYIESTVPGNKTMKMSGTSMATPFVAGLAALAFREAPGLSGYQMKNLILGTGTSLGALYGRVSSGARVDAANLIVASKSMVSTMSSQPSYKPSYQVDRSVASEGGGAGGCGLVKSVTQNGPGTGEGGSLPSGAAPIGVIIGLFMVPMIVWQVLRTRAPKSRRKHERFKMNSQISVSVGGRELVGSMQTISEGGLSFNTDAALEKGGIVTMRIQSPDGHEVIEVQGQVVWNEANQAYGVQFANARQGTLAMIRDWTAGLMKT